MQDKNVNQAVEMVGQGAVHPLTAFISTETDTKRLLSQASEYMNIDESQQAQLFGIFNLHMGKLLMSIISVFRILAHCLGLPAEMLLNHKFGYKAIEPISLLIQFVSAAVGILFVGFGVFFFIGFISVFSGDASISELSSRLEQLGMENTINPNDISLSVLFIVSLFLFHYLSMLYFYVVKKGKRLSSSTGIPWIYSLTKIRWFLHPFYIAIVQPVILLCFFYLMTKYNEITLAFLESTGTENAVGVFRESYQSDSIYTVGVVFFYSSLAWLARGLVDFNNLWMAVLEKDDRLLLARFQELVQKRLDDELNRALDIEKEKYESGEQISQEVVELLAHKGKIEKPVFN